MVFAPKLEGGVAYNQPIETPNAMSAVAGLFNFGLDVATKASAGGKPTADEQFALDIREWEANEGIGGGVDWTREKVRKAIFQMPQHREKIISWAEDLGVMTRTPQEVANQDALLEWAKTPEGVVAAAYTKDMSPAEGEAHMAQQFTNYVAEQAAVEKVNRETAKLEASGKLVDAQWNSLKTTQKSFVSNLVGSTLPDIIERVRNGETVEVPESLKAAGVTYDNVNQNNLSLALMDLERLVVLNAQQSYLRNYGSVQAPNTAWTDEVLAPLRMYTEIAKQFDDPVEQLAYMKAASEMEALKEIDSAGLGVVMTLMKTIPPDTMNYLMGQMPDIVEKLKPLLSVEGKPLTLEETKEAAAGLSKAEAEEAAKGNVAILAETMTPEVFYAFKEAAKRSGFNVVDGASFKEIVGSNVVKIKELTSSNPEFRTEFSSWLVSDINQTVSLIRSNLIAGVNLEFDGKQFVLTPTPGTLAEQKWDDLNRPYKQSALNQLPDGLTIEMLNEKISSLPLLGDVGKEIQEAVGILNDVPKEGRSPAGRVPKGRGRGGDTVTKSSKGGIPEPENWTAIRNGIFAGESGGDYDALFGFSNKPGGRFEGVKLTEMTVDEAIAFTDPSGPYAQWVKGQVGRVATPVGAFQVVGTTLRAAKEGMGLSGSETMDEALQDQIGLWIYNEQGTQAWEGYKGPRDSYDPAPHAARAEAGYQSPTAPLSIRSDSSSIDSGVMTGGTPLNIPAEAVGGATEGLTAEQVAQLVERVKQAPEQAVQIVQEAMAGRPMDPMIKALIEALVGGKA